MEQEKRSLSRAWKLYTEILTQRSGCILMDDETQVKEDFRQIPGHSYYTKKIGSIIDH